MENKRKKVRYVPNDELIIELLSDDDRGSRPPYIGYVRDQSFSGLAAVFHNDLQYEIDESLNIQVGRMPSLRCKIIWKKQIDEELQLIGIKFI